MKVNADEETLIRQGKCPTCQGQLYNGPEGDLAMVVWCGCGSKFLVARTFTPEWLVVGSAPTMRTWNEED